MSVKYIIAKKFPHSEILFSESAALRDHTRDLIELLTEELAHAAVADCIVVLDVSRGAHVEVDRFTTYPILAAKLVILLPERWVGGTGLVSQVHKNARVLGFSDAQLDSCEVATKMSVSIVDTFAVEKLMASSLSPYL